MKKQLIADDLDGFLASYERYMQSSVFELAAIPVTQIALPKALRKGFKYGTVKPDTLLTLSRLVRNGSLLICDNHLSSMIEHLAPTSKAPPKGSSNSLGSALPNHPNIENELLAVLHPGIAENKPARESFTMKRISIVSTFTIKNWSASDAFDFRRNLCNSNQETEFLRAVRQFFPSMQSYPNVLLRSFIDLDSIGSMIPNSFREFACRSQVDILLCTSDEDPVAGFELDSSWHDSGDAKRRDDIKNKLFELSGLPLFRIRHNDPRFVRAEDFYDLLNAEPALDEIRPRRLRSRRFHDGLVPEKVETVRR